MFTRKCTLVRACKLFNPREMKTSRNQDSHSTTTQLFSWRGIASGPAMYAGNLKPFSYSRRRSQQC